MNNEEAKKLYRKYLDGTCSTEERLLVERWYRQEIEKRGTSAFKLDYDAIDGALWKEIEGRTQPQKRMALWPKYAAALLVVLTIGAGIFYFNQGGQTRGTNSVTAVEDIPPGTNGATLTLADGRKIVLSGSDNTKIASENGIEIRKTREGQLVYAYPAGKSAASGKVSGAVYNVLTTARGQTYQVVLPDGTQVWLNSESSIRFSATLNTQPVRSVEIAGEAYFEVATLYRKHPDKHDERIKVPFIVHSGKQDVEVLGTHFNISNYSNESVIRTTLMEGSVKVKQAATAQSVVLTPGQQANASAAGQMQVTVVDTEEVMAWKNGYFIFNDNNIEDIMRKLSRWYNIEVFYAEDLSDLTFMGAVSKSKNISSVLKVMESTGNVKFKIEGRRVTVRR